MAVDAASRTLSPRLLILRRDNIGDLVCTTPLLAALRAQLPKAWLGALVTTYNAEVLARNPALDEVFVYEKLKHRSGSLLSHLRTRLGQVSRLRQQKLDCVLVPAPAPQALKLARSLKPAQVIASPTRFSERLHEVERVFELGRSFGLAGKPGALQLFPDPQKAAELQRALGAGGFVAIHISARRPAQRWPVKRYAALAAQLAREARVLLLWAPGSKDNPRHPGDDEAAAAGLQAAPARIPVPAPDPPTLIAPLSLAGLAGAARRRECGGAPCGARACAGHRRSALARRQYRRVARAREGGRGGWGADAVRKFGEGARRRNAGPALRRCKRARAPGCLCAREGGCRSRVAGASGPGAHRAAPAAGIWARCEGELPCAG